MEVHWKLHWNRHEYYFGQVRYAALERYLATDCAVQSTARAPRAPPVLGQVLHHGTKQRYIEQPRLQQEGCLKLPAHRVPMCASLTSSSCCQPLPSRNRRQDSGTSRRIPSFTYKATKGQSYSTFTERTTQFGLYSVRGCPLVGRRYIYIYHEGFARCSPRSDDLCPQPPRVGACGPQPSRVRSCSIVRTIPMALLREKSGQIK